MTTKVDLDALDALHAAATAGEWTNCFGDTVDSVNGARIAWCDTDVGPDDDGEFHNAALIVALHNAYPALAAELRRARKIEAAARTVMVTVRNACDTQTRHAMLDRLDHALALDAPDESGGR